MAQAWPPEAPPPPPLKPRPPAEVCPGASGPRPCLPPGLPTLPPPVLRPRSLNFPVPSAHSLLGSSPPTTDSNRRIPKAGGGTPRLTLRTQEAEGPAARAARGSGPLPPSRGDAPGRERAREPGAILETLSGPRRGTYAAAAARRGASVRATRAPGRKTRGGSGPRRKVSRWAAGAAEVEPHWRPSRDQRLGCGRSAGGRVGGSRKRGTRVVARESRGPSRRHPRSPGWCVGEAARDSR